MMILNILLVLALFGNDAAAKERAKASLAPRTARQMEEVKLELAKIHILSHDERMVNVGVINNDDQFFASLAGHGWTKTHSEYFVQENNNVNRGNLAHFKCDEHGVLFYGEEEHGYKLVHMSFATRHELTDYYHTFLGEMLQRFSTEYTDVFNHEVHSEHHQMIANFSQEKLNQVQGKVAIEKDDGEYSITTADLMAKNKELGCNIQALKKAIAEQERFKSNLQNPLLFNASNESRKSWRDVVNRPAPSNGKSVVGSGENGVPTTLIETTNSPELRSQIEKLEKSIAEATKKRNGLQPAQFDPKIVNSANYKNAEDMRGDGVTSSRRAAKGNESVISAARTNLTLVGDYDAKIGDDHETNSDVSFAGTALTLGGIS